MPFAHDLLEQSRHLANRERKKPKQASLRRAVSTAYYALFHLLASEAAKNWKRPAERNTVARMFDHGPMGRGCAATERAENTLQYRWSRTDTLEKIDSVEAAFLSWKTIREEHEAQNFLVTLLLRERKN